MKTCLCILETLLVAVFLCSACSSENSHSETQRGITTNGDKNQEAVDSDAAKKAAPTDEEENTQPSADEKKDKAVVENDNENNKDDDPLTSSCPATDLPRASPKTIEETITLINSLPKPLTIECFILALERPLKLYGTKSQLSVQPAAGENNPRIFIFIDRLVITFALAGKGSETVEFSYFVTNTTSVKGELPFPVTGNLAANAAYTSILREAKDGTRCASCHFEEQKAPVGFDQAAYSSKALRPFDRQEVSLDEFNTLFTGCASDTSMRCRILKALLSEAAKIQPFSSDVGTLF